MQRDMRKRGASIKSEWIIMWLALAAAVTASGWRPFASEEPRRPRGVPPEQLTGAWQAAHCPPDAQANLPDIALSGGRVADVEILEILGTRIYLPRPWTAGSRHAYGPSPDGHSARTGGSGSFEPWLGPGADDPCRGRLFLSIPGERGDDPRFTLGLVFRHSSTGSVSGAIEAQKGEYPFAHQIVELNFFGPENASPETAPLLRIPAAAAGEGQDLADGWQVVRRDDKRPINRLAFDARALAKGEPAARAVEVLEGWALVFPLDEKVWAKVVVDRDVPPARWRTYGQKAEQLYRWFQTKPAERGPLPNSF